MIGRLLAELAQRAETIREVDHRFVPAQTNFGITKDYKGSWSSINKETTSA